MPSDVDRRMAVEVLVLGGEEGLLISRFGIASIGTKTRFSLRVFGQQPAIAGMDAGDGRRLVVGELPIVRQIAAVTARADRCRPPAPTTDAASGPGTAESSAHEDALNRRKRSSSGRQRPAVGVRPLGATHWIRGARPK